MKITQAALQDIKQIAALFNQYRQFYNQSSDQDGAETYLTKRLKKEESIIFLAKDEERCVGFVQLYPTYSSIHMKRAWILNDLFVAESSRKKGVGEKLLDAAMVLAKETGAASIALSTASDNEKAQRLYERKGYVRDQQFYHYELSL
jgi:ribosomal protein S18 acetylase RimI-like enzyme